MARWFVEYHDEAGVNCSENFTDRVLHEALMDESNGFITIEGIYNVEDFSRNLVDEMLIRL